MGRPDTLGIIYRNERPTFEERFPSCPADPLVKQEQFNAEKLERTLNEFR